MDTLKTLPDKFMQGTRRLLALYHPDTLREKGLWWSIGLLIVTYLLIIFVLSILWSQEPESFDVREATRLQTGEAADNWVTGAVTCATLMEVAQTMLDKPGGYVSNDVSPPTIFLDNMPNWEFGVLTQVRDLARVLRNDMSRSQSQSVEDPDLSQAEPQWNFPNDSWLFPPTEKEYQKGIDLVGQFLARLTDPQQATSQFYARADNLVEWLGLVEKRLGSLSQRLSASVNKTRINTDLAGDNSATQSTNTPKEISVKTPWLDIDNVFYEARGATWALIHFLKAIEIDFADVLNKKNALASMQQIIRELESSQATVWSPMVLNGRGFGFVANYSLVMTSYISRANAALIDLRSLLTKG